MWHSKSRSQCFKYFKVVYFFRHSVIFCEWLILCTRRKRRLYFMLLDEYASQAAKPALAGILIHNALMVPHCFQTQTHYFQLPAWIWRGLWNFVTNKINETILMCYLYLRLVLCLLDNKNIPLVKSLLVVITHRDYLL